MFLVSPQTPDRVLLFAFTPFASRPLPRFASLHRPALKPVPPRPWSRASTLSTKCQPQARDGRMAGIPIAQDRFSFLGGPRSISSAAHRVVALRRRRYRRSILTFWRSSVSCFFHSTATMSPPPPSPLCVLRAMKMVNGGQVMSCWGRYSSLPLPNLHLDLRLAVTHLM